VLAIPAWLILYFLALFSVMISFAARGSEADPWGFQMGIEPAPE
jgi:hypothetical protein